MSLSSLATYLHMSLQPFAFVEELQSQAFNFLNFSFKVAYFISPDA